MIGDDAHGRPPWLVTRLTDRLFRDLPLPEAWAETVRASAKRGAVVHVVRNESLLDLLAIEYLSRRFDLPRLGFSNVLEGVLDPRALAARGSPSARLRVAIESDRSALLFMKRPPGVLAKPSSTRRGRNEGDDLFRAVVELQRVHPRDIVMVPEIFVWTQRPERLGFSLIDTIFGSAEFPGELRALAQYALNHKNSILRAGEPLEVRELLALEAAEDDETIARRLSYAMLRRLERERRSVLGPVRKPVDRVREEVLRSPKLQAAIRDLSGPGELERAVFEGKAREMLRELEARPDPQTLRGLEMLAETLASRVYAGIDVDEAGLEQARDAAKRGSIVFLPSHKSHVDYLLLSFVLRKHGLMIPIIAAGDNLDFFPVGPLFRHAGAFFIRRSFKGDRLYTAVVDAYVRRLLRDGHAIEFFLEGGRSRTGKLLAPKLGLLNMVADAALGLDNRPVSFVPVSIGYERMMEEGAYARELSGGAKRKEDAAALVKATRVLREKYGRANVQFGKPIELEDLKRQVGIDGTFSPARRRALVTRLAHQVMNEINRVTAVTPGALVALVLLCHGRRGLAHVDLVAHARRLTKLVVARGARTTPSLTRPNGELRESSIREAALLFVRGGLVRQHVPGDTLAGPAKKRARIYSGDDVIYAVPDDQRLMLDLSKNIIVHLFVDRALVSVALLASPETPSIEALAEGVRSLSRLFKLEFSFRADAPFERIFGETLDDMIATGEIEKDGARVRFGPGHDGLDGRGWIAFFAAVARNFIESYRIAARASRVLLRGPQAEKDLVTRALRIGEEMYLGGEIERSEAVNRSTIENAFATLLDHGYLRRDGGKLALAESFASEETAPAIEAKIAGYLNRRTEDLGW